MPARREWALRAALVGFSLLTAVVTLEAAARAVAWATQQERGMAFDDKLGWRPLPSVSKRGGVWGVTRPAATNALGWRDPERTYAKPRGVKRVVALGDSFTFGADVDDGERFTDQLRQRMPGLDVVNLGVAGYGTDQELLVLEHEAFRYEPDAIVLTVCVLNDLDDIGYERLYSYPKPTFRLDGGQLGLRPPRATWGLRLRNHSYLVETLVQKLANEDQHPVRAEDFQPGDAEPLFAALVQRFLRVAASRHVPVVAVVAHAPTDYDPDDGARAAIVRRVLTAAAVPHIDVREVFAPHSTHPDQELFSPVGRHWNARGNGYVAEALQNLLASLHVP